MVEWRQYVAEEKERQLVAIIQEECDRNAERLCEQNKAYNEFCETNALKRYDDRLQTAKWDREEASRAVQAAKRYRKKQEIDQILEKDYNSRNPTGAETTYGIILSAVSASTTQAKLQGYLLNSNHPVGKHKARVINSVLGYHYENWNALADKIYQSVQYAEVTKMTQNQYGRKYTVPMSVVGKKGKSMILNTAWQIDTGGTVPRLYTVTFDKKTIRTEE